MDPFTWALIYWVGVAAFLYWGAQKALELWPVEAAPVVQQSSQQSQQRRSRESTPKKTSLKQAEGKATQVSSALMCERFW